MRAAVTSREPESSGGFRQRRMNRDPHVLITFVLLAAAAIGTGIPGSRLLAQTPKNQVDSKSPTTAVPDVKPHRVIVYYFHTTYRCASCRAIEAYSREAIESAFAEEVKDGRLVWNVVNVEAKGNEHFVKEYRLYSKSLVLVNEIRGKPERWKNLEKIWQLLMDKDKFLRYVQDETRIYLAART